jgi:hypothetical protein
MILNYTGCFAYFAVHHEEHIKAVFVKEEK